MTTAAVIVTAHSVLTHTVARRVLYVCQVPLYTWDRLSPYLILAIIS